MNKARLEAFSDGMFAIIITIMVLEIKIPGKPDWESLAHLLPVLYSYLLSFLFIGTYWVNHHHLLHTLGKVSSGILWANLNLLFWLSLTPVATGWMGENHFAANTVVIYAVLLSLDGIAFTILQFSIEKTNRGNPALTEAFRSLRRKGILSMAGYLSSVPIALFNPAISGILFLLISVIWLIPERKIEKALNDPDA